MKHIEEVMKELERPDVEVYVNNMNLSTIETEFHQHPLGQLIYAEGGIIHIFVNDKHWYLLARCLMWIPADTPHAIITRSKQVELYNFYFKVDDLADPFYANTSIYFANDLFREMVRYTKKWEGIIDRTQAPKYYLLKALLENLPVMESTKVPATLQHPYPKDPKLLEIATFLNGNLETSYSLEDIARKFGFSSRSLSRKFKDDLGMSYVRFLRSLRITKAFQLIAEQQHSIYEIALAVGYSSLSAFSNVFYLVAGIRPTDYQKLLNPKK